MAYSYARRKQLALEKFGADPSGQTDPYTYYRKVSEYVRDNILWSQETGLLNARDDFESASLYYQAFERGDEDDYTVHIINGQVGVEYIDGKPHGAKAALLIDVFGYVTDAAEWRALYPTSTRFGHLLPEGTVRAKPRRPRKKMCGAKNKAGKRCTRVTNHKGEHTYRK